MDTTKHRVKGMAEKVAGRVKETAGAATANRDLEAEGRGQQAVGETREKAARAAGRVKGKIHEGVGKLEQKLNQPKRKPPAPM
jgi:uncharacterized protein YjbJ (UPF0337 family)